MFGATKKLGEKMSTKLTEVSGKWKEIATTAPPEQKAVALAVSIMCSVMAEVVSEVTED